jgi:hypothetical protein
MERVDMILLAYIHLTRLSTRRIAIEGSFDVTHLLKRCKIWVWYGKAMGVERHQSTQVAVRRRNEHDGCICDAEQLK